jgi:hypothetical protein
MRWPLEDENRPTLAVFRPAVEVPLELGLMGMGAKLEGRPADPASATGSPRRSRYGGR